MAGAVTCPLPTWARLRPASCRACFTAPGLRVTPGRRRRVDFGARATTFTPSRLATTGATVKQNNSEHAVPILKRSQHFFVNCGQSAARRHSLDFLVNGFEPSRAFKHYPGI